MYKIAIPSYGRFNILIEQTLVTLDDIDRNSIFIFVNEEDKQLEQYKSLSKQGYNVIVLKIKSGLEFKRNAIFKYFKEGELVIQISDDIKKLMEYDDNIGKPVEVTDIKYVFEDFFNIMIKENYVAWGVSPHSNGLILKSCNETTEGLVFLIGDLFGYINKHSYHLTATPKEDFEFSIQAFKNGGNIRFNKFYCSTKPFNPVGGLEGNHLKRDKQAVEFLLKHYGEYIQRVKQKPNGWSSIIFKRIKPANIEGGVKQSNVEEDEDDYKISIIATMKPNDDIGNAIVEYLKDRPLPMNTSRENVGYGLSQTMGHINDRRGNFNLSGFTKSRMDLYELIQALAKRYIPKFKYTSIQVNQNLECKEHLDKNNIGQSVIVGLGDYGGGDLVVEGVPYNIKGKFVKFNGAFLRHYTAPIKKHTTRISLVYFNQIPNKKHPRDPNKKIEYVQCPICGAELQKTNLARHHKGIHLGEAEKAKENLRKKFNMDL